MTLPGAAVFDRAALVHRVKRQRQIDHHAWADRPSENEIDELRQVPLYRRGTAEQTHITEEQIGAIERDEVRHADVTDRSARSRGLMACIIGSCLETRCW